MDCGEQLRQMHAEEEGASSPLHPCYIVITTEFRLDCWANPPRWKEIEEMFRFIIHWLLGAIALMAVSRIVQGFYINSESSAMLVAVVIGFLNAILGFLLKLITFPLAFLTFGLFLLAINTAMILLASHIVVGFYVSGWVPALWGAAALSILGLFIRFLAKE
jgi:putative membrane protein